MNISKIWYAHTGEQPDKAAQGTGPRAGIVERQCPGNGGSGANGKENHPEQIQHYDIDNIYLKWYVSVFYSALRF